LIVYLSVRVFSDTEAGMSDQNENAHEPMSRAAIRAGAIVGLIAVTGTGLLAWPAMAGWDPMVRWLAMIVGGAGIFSLGILAVAIGGGILEAVIRIFQRTHDRRRR
jgi:hypothetical protein